MDTDVSAALATGYTPARTTVLVFTGCPGPADRWEQNRNREWGCSHESRLHTQDPSSMLWLVSLEHPLWTQLTRHQRRVRQAMKEKGGGCGITEGRETMSREEALVITKDPAGWPVAVSLGDFHLCLCLLCSLSPSMPHSTML